MNTDNQMLWKTQAWQFAFEHTDGCSMVNSLMNCPTSVQSTHWMIYSTSGDVILRPTMHAEQQIVPLKIVLPKYMNIDSSYVIYL